MENQGRKEIEVCPKCMTVFLGYDRVTKQAFCLQKSCGHKWELPSNNSDDILNKYLRAAMG